MYVCNFLEKLAILPGISLILKTFELEVLDAAQPGEGGEWERMDRKMVAL